MNERRLASGCILRHSDRSTAKAVRLCVAKQAIHLLFGLLALTSTLSGQEPDGERFFTEKIEPIFKQHCFECHSHASELSGGLTLDSRSGWETGGDHGPAVVANQPSESLLIQAVQRNDVDLQMPPEKKLDQESIDLLIRWIQLGAPDPRSTAPEQMNVADPMDWWSLRPLSRPSIPTTPGEATGANSVEHPVDAFVSRKLRENGILAAPTADRRTLIRRVYFDLHGLPPTPQDVDAFVDDSDPLAYEKLVGRLLDSPRYGERWARHWLDTVHFADSHGCEHDVLRPNAWRYRDYVIESFNNDTPWSEFIRQQLAADQFFPEQPQLTAALGFIAAGPLELSRAGTAPVTFDYLDRDDMVTQTMAAFASTTANCARCHDHKFDPVSQEDYYSLQAVFAGIGKGDIEFDTKSEVAAERRRWNDLRLAAQRGDHEALDDPEHAAIVKHWETQFGKKSAIWEPLLPSIFLSSDGATLKRLDDNSILATELRPDQDTYTITAPIALSKLTALRVDVLVDESLPKSGPGRADNGNLHLSECEAFVFDPNSPTPTQLKFRQAVADWDQEGWTIAHALDMNVKTAWGIYPNVSQPHHAVFELDAPLELKPSTQIVVVLKQLHGGGHLIGRVKLYATDALAAAAKVVPDAVASALKLPRDDRSNEQQTAINSHALLLHAQRQLDGLPEMSTVYAASNRYSHAKKLDTPITPKIVNVLRRGDIYQPGEVAAPGALSAITVLPGRFDLGDPNEEGSRRAALAQWLTAKKNPLTWRSIVNRVWHYHFGRGLCDTPNDFGRMGDQPSHPELLDWLAVWFRDDANGSLKQLHRLIMLSSTYQRSSIAAANSVDVENRLHWRGNARPLDAESFRDAVLQISGRIDLTMGGPGIQQFTQSKGQQSTPKLDYDAFDWNSPSAARRSIYRVVWRGIADPFMESLNFPDLGLLAPKRDSSVSALQSLTLLNNAFVLHHSQLLANEIETKHAIVTDQVRDACRLVYLREPKPNEIAILVKYTEQHGLAATCRILFNSNEFLIIP